MQVVAACPCVSTARPTQSLYNLAEFDDVGYVAGFHGDKVRLQDWGMMKLEIESDKVDNLKDFRAKKHIRGVRLHFIPESYNGTQALYDGITFEKDKTFPQDE